MSIQSPIMDFRHQSFGRCIHCVRWNTYSKCILLHYKASDSILPANFNNAKFTFQFMQHEIHDEYFTIIRMNYKLFIQMLMKPINPSNSQHTNKPIYLPFYIAHGNRMYLFYDGLILLRSWKYCSSSRPLNGVHSVMTNIGRRDRESANEVMICNLANEIVLFKLRPGFAGYYMFIHYMRKAFGSI